MLRHLFRRRGALSWTALVASTVMAWGGLEPQFHVSEAVLEG